MLASREEGMATVLLEAMASGVPVAATSAGGNAEVVEDSVSGLVVPPGDAGGLARAIVTMLGDRELAERLATNGRRRVMEMFSIEKTVERTQEIYEELLASKFSGRMRGGRDLRRSKAM